MKPNPSLAYPRRVINVTFRVDDLVLLWASGNALREGRSLNAVVNEFLEDYSDVHPPEFLRPQRRRARHGPPLIDATKLRKDPEFRRRLGLKPLDGGGPHRTPARETDLADGAQRERLVRGRAREVRRRR